MSIATHGWPRVGSAVFNAATPLGERTARRFLVPLAVGFVILDLAALVLLGPVSPNDTAAEIARLYGERPAQVLVSRLVHCLGLAVAFGFVGVLTGQLRRAEGGPGTLSKIVFAGLVALVPIEVVRNVMFVALALRYDDIGDAALPIHVIAVLLGPSIAVPITAALGALAVLLRSWIVAIVAIAWTLSILRLATLSTVAWYGGVPALFGLLAVLILLAIQLARDDPATPEAS